MKKIVLVAVVAIACKKSTPQGLPPANDWGSGSNSPQSATSGHPTGDLPPGHPSTGQLPPPTTDQLPPGHPSPDQMPADHPPVAAKTLTKLADGRLALGPYAIKLPAGWTEAPTTSDMRAAQFTIGDAELVVYYFGDQGAGSTQANIDRWVGQFSKPDGKPKIEQVKVVGKDATIVSASGHYTAMAMGSGTSDVDKDDQMLLGAITQSPSGPYYWKLVGPRATVTANSAKFRTLLNTMALKP